MRFVEGFDESRSVIARRVTELLGGQIANTRRG
jgi:hypothetical protein